MTNATLDKRVGQVVQVLSELKHLHDELALVVRRKLDAMRAADTDALRSAVAREEFLAQRIREQDGLRRQIVELIGAALGRSAAESRAMTVSELAECLGEPARSRLLLLAGALRERVRETGELNRVAGAVSREMLRHFRHVFQVMAQASPPSGGVYTRSGFTETRTGMSVFEAVG